MRANPRHRVCTDSCRLWLSPTTPACVCLDSMNVHLCGPDCTLPSRVSSDNDGYVCPLTHISLPGCIYTQTASYDRNGRRQTHWDSYKKKKTEKTTRSSSKKRRRKPPTRELSEAVASRCFAAAQERHKIRSIKSLDTVRLAARRSPPTTFSQAARLIHQHALRPVRHAPGLAGVLGRVIANFLSKNPKLHLGSADISVACMMTLLSNGLQLSGTTVVDKCPFLDTLMPRPNDMRFVSRINCRGMSAGIRSFKDYALSLGGTPIYSRCLRLTSAERKEIFTCFNRHE